MTCQKIIFLLIIPPRLNVASTDWLYSDTTYSHFIRNKTKQAGCLCDRNSDWNYNAISSTYKLFLLEKLKNTVIRFSKMNKDRRQQFLGYLSTSPNGILAKGQIAAEFCRNLLRTPKPSGFFGRKTELLEIFGGDGFG